MAPTVEKTIVECRMCNAFVDKEFNDANKEKFWNHQNMEWGVVPRPATRDNVVLDFCAFCWSLIPFLD